MMRRVVSLSMLVVMGACSSESPETYKKHVPGTYELYVGSNQTFARRDFSESSLSIKSDGTFDQSCLYRSPQPALHSSGTWTIVDRNIHFDTFIDCAGVYPPDSTFKGASLIVEWSQKPQILLHPDANIFYRRVE